MGATQSRTYIGGQAVIEGVMMRAPSSIAVVCRRRGGELVVRERPWSPVVRGPKSWPFVRGIAAVRESLGIGSRALRWSAALYDRDTGGSPQTSSVPAPVLAALYGVLALVTRADDAEVGEGEALADPVPEEKPRRFAALLPLTFALLLLVALPQGLAELVNYVLGLELPVTSAAFQVLTGASQLAILVGYLLLLRRIPEIRRVFEYHGAEHKTVSTFEAGAALSVAEARGRTTLHARCGTTFLVMVALVSVVAFTAAGAVLPLVVGPGAESVAEGGGRFWAGLGFFFVKLPLIPLVAAVTFELQRLFARLSPEGPLGFLLWPGFWVQRITTQEPDDAELEVALAALHAARWRDGRSDAPVPPDRVFSSFAALAEDRGYV
jgi:uncharacterized protein YqhQ